MRLGTFRHHNHEHAAVFFDDKAVSLKRAGFDEVLQVIAGGAEAREKVAVFLAKQPPEAIMPLSSVTLCAPIPKPSKILCVGLNYRNHAKEAQMELPSVPTIFAKWANTAIGSGADIVLPKNSTKPDYEAEFAFVIGRGGRYIKAADWRDHVYGYMNLNDISARDYQLATSQWTMGKNFDTFAPMGPWITTADEIADPHNLRITLTLNGEKLQDSNTSELIFKIPDLIEFLSSVMTLEPGDIVTTGTPSGVGFSHKPPKWLTPGAEVVVAIDGLGELRNRCVAEA
jgi:2-keto-4-pentenoate hydratase/2-oxohepta-3-ene-1,7-dioic acid hydratase in catechol pathway